ncbi:hypothetical protein HCUR_00127 [Holospora curviuscula]|uniref:Uncharacterized protein n=1 Tax=Holospora curviuscula TaxID=1082868 RepID=A0A2S5RHQ9_9PROT|nr:hypothetical protein HCUR_00127 [Holospora curviuscula]
MINDILWKKLEWFRAPKNTLLFGNILVKFTKIINHGKSHIAKPYSSKGRSRDAPTSLRQRL